MTKSFQACNAEGIKLISVVVEALGGWHEDAAPVVSKLARQLASHASKDAVEQTRYLLQRLSLLLMRGSTALILTRTPAHADAVVGGD